MAKEYQKLDADFTEKIIKDQLIYKDNQLKVVLKKYIEITSPNEQLSEDKLLLLTTELNKEINVYEFQIAKAARQLEAQNNDRQQNQELHRTIAQRATSTSSEIEQLREVFVAEEIVKKNKQSFEQLSSQIVKFDDIDTVLQNIQRASANIDKLQQRHKESQKLIKQKEKQLQLMLHCMKDLIETQECSNTD